MRRRYDWVGGGVSERVGSERKRERPVPLQHVEKTEEETNMPDHGNTQAIIHSHSHTHTLTQRA